MQGSHTQTVECVFPRVRGFRGIDSGAPMRDRMPSGLQALSSEIPYGY